MKLTPARSDPRERRAATRYRVGLRIEIWPESHRRSANPAFVRTRDMSTQGIYFLSETEREVDLRFNFAVIFLRELTGEAAELIKGVGRVIRCERLETEPYPSYGVALAIERTARLIGR